VTGPLADARFQTAGLASPAGSGCWDTVVISVETSAAEHTVERPHWTCRGCGLPWPCENARATLRRSMTGPSLAIYAAAQLDVAVRELPSLSPAELWTRFVAWTKP
jgi:hypothetical protein